MLDKNLIVGIYQEPDSLIDGVTKLRKHGVEVFDCYTPFPVHNLDKAMGIKRSNLTIGAFLCGFMGFLSGLLLQFYMQVFDWPMNIGGKPDNYMMIPSMVPVTFELTILFTAFGMGILFFIRAKMIHGIKEDIIDRRQTNDLMLLTVEGNQKGMNKGEVIDIMKKTGAVEIRERNGDESQHNESEPKSEAAASESSIELTAEERNTKLDLLKRVMGDAGGKIDDLKKISGIGPVYEKQLNALGISSFEQVSRLTPDAIKAIEDLTKYFPGRIERDDWVGQAKKFMEENG